MCIRDRVLVADIVEEAILGVDIMNVHGFIVNIKNNVSRIRKEEVMLTITNMPEKLMDMINQVAVTIPLNSEKSFTVRTKVDIRGNQCSIPPGNQHTEHTNWQKFSKIR